VIADRRAPVASFFLTLAILAAGFRPARLSDGGPGWARGRAVGGRKWALSLIP